jgi:superoxide reductase
MQSRRDLARLALTGAALAALPSAANAAADPNQNIIFTKDDPAHWAGKEATHVPQVTASGSMLMVKTPHPMTDAHFIVSHTVVLDGGRYLDRKVFTPKDQPESMFTLPAGYKGKVMITSTCNLHDLWMTTITV